MQGFKKCANGHFYKENLPQCPYCPLGGQSNTSNSDRTIAGGGGDTQLTDSGKTENLGGFNTEDRTQVFGGSTAVTSPANQPFANAPGADSFDRTFIGGITNEEEKGSDGGPAFSGTPRAARRIVGWLISYTLDPMGMDYRIYEGNNPIGRDATNSIILVKDSTISGKHLNILFRGGKYWAKDEMSANGSFLNGQEMEIEKAYPLNDGDELRLGNTVFKFKSSL